MQIVKGAQRRMVQMRIGDSPYYEEAFFIVRKDLPKIQFPEREMLAEANRILGDGAVQKERKKESIAKNLAWFFGGMVLGLGLSLLAFFLRFGT
ncbi:MAG: hypothetical protein E7680_01590 [Ruminococcaceae bacterium]|nr:hypothetical protein [Oscillospiraceae bacterium]